MRKNSRIAVQIDARYIDIVFANALTFSYSVQIKKKNAIHLQPNQLESVKTLHPSLLTELKLYILA